VISGLLDKSVTIERPSVERTPAGETVRSYRVIAAGVPTFAQLLTGSAYRQDVGFTPSDSWRAFFMPTADVQQHDRVLLAGAYYHVQSVDTIRGHHIEAELVRMPLEGV
jgi:hypothetical protein